MKDGGTLLRDLRQRYERVNALTGEETVEDIKHFPWWQDCLGA